jgi:hypothetical protein
MRATIALILGGLLAMLSGCAANTVQEPQIERISPEELERIMPKPLPNLTLDQIVELSKAGSTPEQIIDKIKASNSRYSLTPSESLELSKKGVSAKVLDYIQAAHEQAIRDGFADEINKREKQKRQEQERLRREYQLRYQPFYDPFWYGYGFGPSWRYRYGPGFHYW